MRLGGATGALSAGSDGFPKSERDHKRGERTRESLTEARDLPANKHIVPCAGNSLIGEPR